MTLRSIIEFIRRSHPDTTPNMVRILVNQAMMRLYEEAPLFYPELTFTLVGDQIEYPFENMEPEGDYEFSSSSVTVHRVFVDGKETPHRRQNMLPSQLVWAISAGKNAISLFYQVGETVGPWKGPGKEASILVQPRAIKLSEDESKEPYLDEEFHIGLVDYVQQRLYAEKQILQMSSWHKERWSETMLLAKRKASRQGKDTYTLMSEDF